MISDNLKAARQAHGISQEELASRLHVVRQTVSKWEQGRSVPDADTLVRISEVLETDVATLLGSTPAKEENEGRVIDEALATQLAQLNEQLAIQNRRRHRIWTTIGVILAVILLFTVVSCVLGMVSYDHVVDTSETVVETSETVAGMIAW